MAAESNVGARLFLIGKDATLAGVNEIRAAVAALNKEIAAGGKSSDVAAGGYDEQEAALVRLNATMDLYKANLAESEAEMDAVASVGKVAFLGLAAAGAVWGYESIKWAQNYQTQLVRLRTQAGLTVTAMNAIGAAAMKNAASLGTTPTDYLEAAYHPASTGMGTAETIAITNNAAKLAAIGGAPLEDTTNALTSVMKSYNYRASQTVKTAATLNAIVGAGNMHFSDLNDALSSGVTSTAKTFGVSLPSVGGALAYMTDRGVPASQAGTRLRMTLSLLGAPSKEASTLLQDAGMTSTAAADSTNSMAATLYAAGVQPTQLSSALSNNSGAGGIYNALELLHKNLTGTGLSQEMQAAMISRSFGGGRMGTTIESMYNNLPGLKQKTAQIDKNGTSQQLMKDWNAETQTFDFQLKRLGGTVETLGTQFGTALLPVLTEGVKLFTDLTSFMAKNKAIAIGLGAAITVVLVPAIGLYLYRSLLSSGGAIRSVISGYQRLILGQSAEQVAAAKTAAALGTDNAALGSNDAALTANDTALASNDALRSGGVLGGLLGFLGGSGGAILGSGATLMGISALGNHAQSVFDNQKAPVIKDAAALQKKIQTLQKQMTSASGGTMGKIESWGPFGAAGKWLTAEHIPRLDSNTAGVEAKDKVLLRQYQNQLGELKKLDPDAFHTAPPASSSSGGGFTIHNYVTVEIDGKEVTKVITKRTKAVAARS